MKGNVGAPTTMVRGLCPRNRIRWVAVARRAHRGKRGCYRSGHTAAPNAARQSRDGGAPGTVRPTTYWESISVKPTPSVNRRKGRRGRRPLRGVRVGTFQRSREVQFITPVTFYVASSVALLPVGCTVLGAPWSRDCRGRLDASVRLDRQHPRHPRCVRLAFAAQRIIFRGHSPRTISCGVGEPNPLPHMPQRPFRTHRRGRRPRRPLRRMIAGAALDAAVWPAR